MIIKLLVKLNPIIPKRVPIEQILWLKGIVLNKTYNVINYK